MDAYHARYPFLDAARDAVADADVDLSVLVQSDHAAVDRGKARVTRALTAGTVDTRVSPRTELLSYPIARVLVSLLDTPGAIEKYAAVEAESAHARVVEELKNNHTDQTVSLETLVAELGLDEAVQRTAPPNRPTAYRVAVDRYLRLAPDGTEWALVRRELVDGNVSVSRTELLELLRTAIEARVLDGLPFDVPPEIAEPLSPVVSEIQRQLVGVEYPTEIDRFEPEALPDCITTLLDRARTEPLDPPERFTLISFLSAVGVESERITEICGDDDRVAYATERLAGETTAYPPPSFETMRAYGICNDQHKHDHPLKAYAANLSQT